MFCDYNFATRVFFGDKLHPYSYYRKLREKNTSSATFLAEAYTKAEKYSRSFNILINFFFREIREKIKNNNEDLWKKLTSQKQHTLHNFSDTLEKGLPNPKRTSDNPEGNPVFIFCGCDMRNGRAFYFSQQKVGSDLHGQPHQKSKYDMTEVKFCTVANSHI